MTERSSRYSSATGGSEMELGEGYRMVIYGPDDYILGYVDLSFRDLDKPQDKEEIIEEIKQAVEEEG